MFSRTTPRLSLRQTGCLCLRRWPPVCRHSRVCVAKGPVRKPAYHAYFRADSGENRMIATSGEVQRGKGAL